MKYNKNLLAFLNGIIIIAVGLILDIWLIGLVGLFAIQLSWTEEFYKRQSTQRCEGDD